jgi:DoxX-like family
MSPGAGGGLPHDLITTAWTETTMTASSAATRTATTPTTASRAGNIGLWTLQVVLAVAYSFSAFGKLTAEAQNVAGFEAMGLGAPGMYAIGVLELAGAIAMFVPRLTGPAALCFVALMIGAVTLTLVIGGGVLALIPAVVGVLAAVVAWGRRRSTAALLAAVRR